ncbi:hypothetical protein EDD18DRAFT_1162257 [Armillaria luteobubalina]|uniref:Uncharacterized protein n=1 Tax=Armillaria luteobubalina TaxID=153913 RepID=A0AA39Q949_9AGAR|nr:hypothetical protein EDD18DRAFT_1162257 [Armillaria luteobubalina]
MPFPWITQLFHTLRRFLMSQDNPEMFIFSRTTDVTSASRLLRALKENYPFLKDGFGNIIVIQIEYCKCSKGSAWEHEFLLVTLKESVGARRSALLLVDRRMDDTKEYAGGQDELLADMVKHQREEIIDTATDPNSSAESESESGALPAAQQWDAPSGIQCSGAKLKSISKGGAPNALDELIILPNRNAIAGELGNHPFEVLMTMDLTRSQLTLERFIHLLRTTSRNTPQYHFIFAQCYWYAYTIWRVLELETQPRIRRSKRADHQCTYSGGIGRLVLGKGKFVNIARAPETVKAQWEVERFSEDKEWAEKRQVSIIMTSDKQISSNRTLRHFMKMLVVKPRPAVKLKKVVAKLKNVRSSFKGGWKVSSSPLVLLKLPKLLVYSFSRLIVAITCFRVIPRDRLCCCVQLLLSNYLLLLYSSNYSTYVNNLRI